MGVAEASAQLVAADFTREVIDAGRLPAVEPGDDVTASLAVSGVTGPS